MARHLEDYLPPVKEDGINTLKGFTADTGSTANFDFSASSGTFLTSTGAVTLGGNVSISGAKTFATGTGAVTLSGAVTQKANLISGSGATVTLTAAQSGSTVLFDRAAGIVYTLPAPAVGLWYEFVVTTTITSNNAKVITDVGTTLIQGSVELATTAAAPNTYFGNGTTHIAVTQNGTTTGGILGSTFRLVCVSSTLWNAVGSLNGSGVLATPFATT